MCVRHSQLTGTLYSPRCLPLNGCMHKYAYKQVEGQPFGTEVLHLGVRTKNRSIFCWGRKKKIKKTGKLQISLKKIIVTQKLKQKVSEYIRDVLIIVKTHKTALHTAIFGVLNIITKPNCSAADLRLVCLCCGWEQICPPLFFCPQLPPLSPSGSRFQNDPELIESGKRQVGLGQRPLLGRGCWCFVTMGEAGRAASLAARHRSIHCWGAPQQLSKGKNHEVELSYERLCGCGKARDEAWEEPFSFQHQEMHKNTFDWCR